MGDQRRRFAGAIRAWYLLCFGGLLLAAIAGAVLGK